MVCPGGALYTCAARDSLQVRHRAINIMTHLTIDYIKNQEEGATTTFKVSETLTVYTVQYYSYDDVDDDDDDYYEMFLHDSLADGLSQIMSLSYVEDAAVITDDLILLQSSHQFALLTKGSEGYSDHPISKNLYDYLKNNLRLPPPEPEWSPTCNGLSKIRSNGNFDFVIESKDLKTYNVHSLVLAGVWPLFKTMLEADMKETSENKMDIPYPHSWVEALLLYFYEEDLKMDFDQATGVVVLAKVYDIPALCDIAIARIRRETLDTKKCLEGWRDVYEARCDSMQLYLAKYLGEHLKELQEASEILAQFSQEETVQLMMDISRSK